MSFTKILGVIGVCVTILSSSFIEYSSQKSREKHLLCKLKNLTIQSVKEKRVIECTASHSCWRGNTSAKVSCPIWMIYGIDLQEIQPEDIRIEIEKQTIEIYIPKVKVTSVDIIIEEMQDDISVGWLRFHSRSGNTQKNLALGKLRQEAILIANQEEYIRSASERTAFLIEEKLENLFPKYHFKIKIKNY